VFAAKFGGADADRADLLDVAALRDLARRRLRWPTRAANQRPQLRLHTQQNKEWQVVAFASEQDSSHTD